MVSRHLQAFDTPHWEAVKRIFRYLQGTLHYGLIFNSNGQSLLTLEGYSDADWSGDSSDRKSTSGYHGYPQESATIIHEDNQGCIALSKNPIFHTRTKHLDVQAHFIREQVRTNKVALNYCPTENMVADFLTKALHSPQLIKLCQLAGIIPTTHHC